MTDAKKEAKVIDPGPYDSDIFSGKQPLSTKQIEYILDQSEGHLNFDVETAQLLGFGSDTFLVAHDPKDRHHRIVAEFKAASGSLITRAYMANAINTWRLLAIEVLKSRKEQND